MTNGVWSRRAAAQHLADRIGAFAASPRGRVVAVAGTCGGAGASTIASNLAWLTGVEMHRHTLLLSTDLYSGAPALDLNINYGPDLRIALESPELINELLIERAVHPVAERFSVLAAKECYTKPINYQKNAANLLIGSLAKHYSLIVGDCGARLWDFSRDVLRLADQIILVVDPSMIAIRNLERMLDLLAGGARSFPMLLVLNQAGRSGGLSEDYLERTHGLAFDVIIPYSSNILPKAKPFGKLAVIERGPFRGAMIKLAQMVDTRAIPALRI